MNHFKNAVFAGAAVLASCAAANAATITIGDFSTTQEVRSTRGQGVKTADEVAAPSSAKVGGYRDMEVVATTAPARLSGVAVYSDEGYLYYNADAGSSGHATVTWAGQNKAGIGGVDITDGGTNDAFFLDVIFVDQDLSLAFTVKDIFGHTASFSRTIIDGVDQTDAEGSYLQPVKMSFLFSDFVGSADFTKLDLISLTLSGTKGGLDATIDTVYAGSTLPTVPVPAAGVLMLGGLAALGALKRRKR